MNINIRNNISTHLYFVIISNHNKITHTNTSMN